jgi:hypothetical protein
MATAKDQLVSLLENVRFRGRITRLYPEGYGFVQLSANVYIFIHRDALGSEVNFADLRQGDLVSLRVRESATHPGKLCGVKVRKADFTTPEIEVSEGLPGTVEAPE